VRYKKLVELEQAPFDTRRGQLDSGVPAGYFCELRRRESDVPLEFQAAQACGLSGETENNTSASSVAGSGRRRYLEIAP